MKDNVDAHVAFISVVAAAADSSTIESAFRKEGAQGVVVAAKAIEKQQGPAEAVRLISQCLGDKNLEFAAAAAHALGTMGDSGKRALPELIDALTSEGKGKLAEKLDKLGSGDIPLWLAEEALRGGESSSGAELALQLIDHDDKRLVPICEKGLANADRDVQRLAILMLGELGPKAADAWQPLVLILEEEPKRQPAPGDVPCTANQIRGTAAFSLGGLQTKPDETVRLLLKFLGHEDRELRIGAALGLGEMGDKAKAAIPALVGRLSDKKMACRPFGCLSWDVPNHAAGIGLIGIGNSALPAVIAALDSPDAHARRFAAETLIYFKTDRTSAVASLLRRLHDPDALVRAQSVVALVDIVPDAKKLVPEIVPLTRDPQSVVRENAASMLGRLKPPEAVPAAPLLRLLDDPVAAVRREAILSLGQVASKQDLAAAVERLRNDPDESVREAVETIAKQVQGKATPPAGKTILKGR